MPVPTTPLVYGDDDYSNIYDYWVEQGRPGSMTNLAEGWRYRVYWPDASASYPTFVLEASSPDLAKVLGTTQISYQGARSLPTDSV